MRRVVAAMVDGVCGAPMQSSAVTSPSLRWNREQCSADAWLGVTGRRTEIMKAK